MEITDAEYELIQDNIANHDIWTEFRDWMIGQKGVSKTTARTYATQAKRILREVEPELTSQKLFDWVNERPPAHRTPFRSSWRSYLAFMETVYATKLPNFQVGGTVPRRVVRALALIKAAGLGSGAMELLTTEQEKGKRYAALVQIDPKLAAGINTLVKDSTGALCIIPTEAYDILAKWGNQTMRFDSDESPRWLIPSVPESKEAMRAVKITRLVRSAKEPRRKTAP